MMIALSYILKYWKAGAIALLVSGLLLSVHVMRGRGEKIDALMATQAQYERQINLIRQQQTQDRERNDFRKSQSKNLYRAKEAPLVLDPDMRAAYDQLRARLAAHSR